MLSASLRIVSVCFSDILSVSDDNEHDDNDCFFSYEGEPISNMPQQLITCFFNTSISLSPVSYTHLTLPTTAEV